MLDDRLTQAARRGNTPEVLTLLRGVPHDHRAEELYLALLWAAMGNQTATMQAVIEAGADVNSVHYRGHTILGSAAKEGSVDAVRLLLEQGADANASDRWGKTALDYALRYKRTAIVTLLERHR